MPWEHCDQAITDDEKCPTCGITKAAWTVQIDTTRTFQIGRQKRPKREKDGWIGIQLRKVDGRPQAGGAFELELPNGMVEKGALDEDGRYMHEQLYAAEECQLRFPGAGELERISGRPGKTHKKAKPKPKRERFRRVPTKTDRLGSVPKRRGRGAKTASAGQLVLPGLTLKGGPTKPPTKGDQADAWHACVTKDTHVFQPPGKKVKADLPLKVSFRTLQRAKRWLLENPILVQVNGQRVPSGVTAQAPDQIRVQFRVPPGEHRLVVSSCPKSVHTKTRRKILLSGRITISQPE